MALSIRPATMVEHRAGLTNDAKECAVAKQPLTAPDGFVYFIRAGRTFNMKIGWAKDPYARLDALQCGSPHKLHLVGYFPGSHQDEKALHYAWPAERVRGEWFNLSNPLRIEINRILMQPGATRYLLVATDWRDIRKQQAELDRLNTGAS